MKWGEVSKALYRKYRSKTLDEVVGQSHITDILKRALASGKIAHAYLLTGPRGVGKTSIARILAHEINQLPYEDESTHLDIIEIDAASNTSVEDVRDLREKARLAPVSAAKKIYIIDEVHMLSKSAFNALLKTLEEPPEHVIFILATTDAEKLPDTILSRVQRFNFRTVSRDDVASHLKSIAKSEKIKVNDEALQAIASHGGGSFRDSISLLDQLQNLHDEEITKSDIESLLGLTPKERIEKLVQAYETNDIQEIIKIVDENEMNGSSATTLANQIITYLRSVIIEKPHLINLVDELLDVPRSNWPHVKLLTALSSNQASVVPVAPQTAKLAPAKPAEKKVEMAVDRPKEESKNDHKPKAAPKRPAPVGEFPWTKFNETIKQESMAIFSLLNNCAYDLVGNQLVIYAGKAFTKKRLESPKYMSEISKALEEIGYEAVEVVISAENKPPKDSQTAEIVAIMGGGQEVSIDGKI